MTNVLYFLLVTRTGFEPVNAAVKGRCVKPLHQRATCGYTLASTLIILPKGDIEVKRFF